MSNARTLANNYAADITGVTAGTGLTGGGTSGTVTVSIDSTVATLSGSQALTNKDLTSGTNTFPTSLATLTGTQTLTNKTLTSPIENGPVISYPFENWYINASAFAGYTAYLQTNNAVHYLTTNATSNGTLNITYTSGATLNSNMSTGQCITFNLLITNGSTAYYPTAFQVDGSSVTPKWSGGTAPSAGNASAIDVYSFSILKTGSATFTVIAAGPIKYS